MLPTVLVLSPQFVFFFRGRVFLRVFSHHIIDVRHLNAHFLRAFLSRLNLGTGIWIEIVLSFEDNTAEQANRNSENEIVRFHERGDCVSGRDNSQALKQVEIANAR